MQTQKKDTRWLAIMALLIAIQLFLNITGIGLIPLPLIKATTLHIPVIVGAILLGPMEFWAVCSAFAPSGTTP